MQLCSVVQRLNNDFDAPAVKVAGPVVLVGPDELGRAAGPGEGHGGPDGGGGPAGFASVAGARVLPKSSC